jgi:signal transduction histidine kinase
VRFRYKLEGMDRDWMDAGTTRAAQYSRLPPGDYEFRVMASSGDGQWREANRTIRFQVVPRVWERPWVQLAATALLVSLVGGSATLAYRRRLRLKLARLEMEQKVETERRRIARDLHDELGSRLKTSGPSSAQS